MECEEGEEDEEEEEEEKRKKRKKRRRKKRKRASGRWQWCELSRLRYSVLAMIHSLSVGVSQAVMAVVYQDGLRLMMTILRTTGLYTHVHAETMCMPHALLHRSLDMDYSSGLSTYAGWRTITITRHGSGRGMRWNVMEPLPLPLMLTPSSLM
ncbi:hypothetical protein BDQ17DRAFT_914461 [Cyathus striatus]|nr:hypothetical protein BDQ17DRAFT_914461 [Cyathus striatus]